MFLLLLVHACTAYSFVHQASGNGEGLDYKTIHSTCGSLVDMYILHVRIHNVWFFIALVNTDFENKQLGIVTLFSCERSGCLLRKEFRDEQMSHAHQLS